jgi:hypothetical protein
LLTDAKRFLKQKITTQQMAPEKTDKRWLEMASFSSEEIDLKMRPKQERFLTAIGPRIFFLNFFSF